MATTLRALPVALREAAFARAEETQLTMSADAPACLTVTAFPVA